MKQALLAKQRRKGNRWRCLAAHWWSVTGSYWVRLTVLSRSKGEWVASEAGQLEGTCRVEKGSDQPTGSYNQINPPMILFWKISRSTRPKRHVMYWMNWMWHSKGMNPKIITVYEHYCSSPRAERVRVVQGYSDGRTCSGVMVRK